MPQCRSVELNPFLNSLQPKALQDFIPWSPKLFLVRKITSQLPENAFSSAVRGAAVQYQGAHQADQRHPDLTGHDHVHHCLQGQHGQGELFLQPVPVSCQDLCSEAFQLLGEWSGRCCMNSQALKMKSFGISVEICNSPPLDCEKFPFLREYFWALNLQREHPCR